MRIGVDASCWSNGRGFGRFTRELLTAMAAADARNSYVYFADAATAAAASFPENVDVVAVETSAAATAAAAADGRRSLRDIWALTRAVRRHELDVVFFPAVYSFFPVLNRARVVVTVHDVIADRHPEATFGSRKHLLFWKAKQRLALRQADLVLTVSEFSRRSIRDYFGLAADRVALTTEAASPVFRPIEPSQDVLTRCGLEPDERFMLYVGGISPHKNLGRLVEAYAELSRHQAVSDVRLVLVGDYAGDVFHSDYPRLKEQIESLGLSHRVTLTGFVPDDDLVHLYNAAQLLVFPSLEEGFGLPAAEAMACGTPVVASDRGSLPEIVGEAGVLFDPLDPRAIEMSLESVLRDDDLRAGMSERGLARSALFSWENAARRTIEHLEALA